MADTWPDGDPLERNGGGLWDTLKGAASGVSKAVTGGLVPGANVDLPGMNKRIMQTATDAVGSQYPGYGDLWTYDTQEGVEVTDKGAIVLGAVAVGLWLVLFSGGR